MDIGRKVRLISGIGCSFLLGIALSRFGIAPSSTVAMFAASAFVDSIIPSFILITIAPSSLVVVVAPSSLIMLVAPSPLMAMVAISLLAVAKLSPVSVTLG